LGDCGCVSELPEDAAAGVGVAGFEPPVFKDELLQDIANTGNSNAATQKTLFIKRDSVINFRL
jgi:hypothetical protein